MGLLVFTKDDKENIKKSLTLITDDIRSMWESSQVESIRIELNLNKDDRFSGSHTYLEVTDKKIGIHEYWYDDHKYYPFERKGRRKSIKTIGNYHIAFFFIKDYDEIIRPKIEQELKKGLSSREMGFEKLEAVKQQYDKHAEVLFEVGQSNNSPIIVLSEEEGNNIGTLYLGNRTLKIIVDGPIKIINNADQKELANVKRKK